MKPRSEGPQPHGSFLWLSLVRAHSKYYSRMHAACCCCARRASRLQHQAACRESTGHPGVFRVWNTGKWECDYCEFDIDAKAEKFDEAAAKAHICGRSYTYRHSGARARGVMYCMLV